MAIQVSIVVPIYKVQEHLLRKCIESCINQNNTDTEIILVDDCSPDNCGKVCDEMASKDERIHVIHKLQNEGLSAARSTGAKAAVGEWITFVDGDDWIDPDTCDLVKQVSDDIQLIIFGAIREYEKGSEPFVMPYHNGQVFYGEACKQLQIDVLDYSKRIATAYGKFARTSFIREFEIYHDPEVRCGIEGVEYNLRLFGHLSKAIVVTEYKYHYVYNLESITGAPSHATNQFVILGIEKMQNYISGKKDNDQLKSQFIKRVQRVIIDTSVGGYFNPNYKLSYNERKDKLASFCNSPTVSTVLKMPYREKSASKKIMYFCTRYRIYPALGLIGKLRIEILKRK